MKYYTIILSGLLLFLNMPGSFAQKIKWQHALGGSDIDQAYSVQATHDSNYIVAGYNTIQPGTDSGDIRGNKGASDAWIIKLNHTGDTLWTNTIGSSGNDQAYAIRQTTNKGYIVAGYSLMDDKDVPSNEGSSDWWVVKLDSTGSITWSRSLGGNNNEIARSVQQTADSGYIVAGNSSSSNHDVHGNHGNHDAWIVKLNRSGDISWTKSLGGSDQDMAHSIRQTADSGYIMAGNTLSDDGDVHGNHGNSDSWVVKLNQAGDTLWTKTLGGPMNEEAFAIRQTPDSNYVMAGYSETTGGDVNSNQAAEDYWIVKLDNKGDIIWSKSYGGSASERAQSIMQTPEGNFIAGGYSRSGNGDVHGNHGRNDYWLIKLNNAGDTLWTASYGGSDNDRAYAINQSPGKNYVVAGYTESNDQDVSGHHGSADFWVIELCGNTYDSISPAACNSYTVPSGDTTYLHSGTYNDTLSNAAGCDSIITINLSIDTVNTMLTQSGDTLMADTAANAYQWLDCDNEYAAISNDTNQYFVPSASGNYAVEITQNNCVDTSDCYRVRITGLLQNDFGSAFNMYPNPSTGTISVNLGAVYDDVKATISNSAGQQVTSHNPGKARQFDMQIQGNAGIYLLTIKTRSGKKARFKIVKK